jgi:hypothetical protein
MDAVAGRNPRQLGGRLDPFVGLRSGRRGMNHSDG